MHIRPLTQADLPDCATVHAQSIADDVYFLYLHPRLNTYPADFRHAFLQKARSRALSPEIRMFVCVTDPSDNCYPPDLEQELTAVDRDRRRLEQSKDCIVGFASWGRAGPKDDACVQAWTKDTRHLPSLAPLNRFLVGLEQRYEQLIRLDRSLDRGHLQRVEKLLASHDAFSRIPSYWLLRGLYVAPWAQRRGVGRMLVQWGIQRATEENVPACLHASDAGLPLYRSLGFRVVDLAGLVVVDGEDAHHEMVWDPERKWIRDLQDGESSSTSRDGVKQSFDVKWRE